MYKQIFKDQRGFTLLEMMIVIVILGILATVAIPKYNNSITSANTAKVQSDLQVLNTAINMHIIQYGKDPAALKDLAEYVDNLASLKPPQGKCFIRTGETSTITITAKDEYTLAASGEAAQCQGRLLEEFGAARE